MEAGWAGGAPKRAAGWDAPKREADWAGGALPNRAVEEAGVGVIPPAAPPKSWGAGACDECGADRKEAKLALAEPKSPDPNQLRLRAWANGALS